MSKNVIMIKESTRPVRALEKEHEEESKCKKAADTNGNRGPDVTKDGGPTRLPFWAEWVVKLSDRVKEATVRRRRGRDGRGAEGASDEQLSGGLS